jgi:hypothetical protein
LVTSFKATPLPISVLESVESPLPANTDKTHADIEDKKRIKENEKEKKQSYHTRDIVRSSVGLAAAYVRLQEVSRPGRMMINDCGCNRSFGHPF